MKTTAMTSLYVCAILATSVSVATCFTPGTTTTTTTTSRPFISSLSSLHAKAKPKSGGGKGSSSANTKSKGGFGGVGGGNAVATNKRAPSETDDTAAFPALDPRVADTLLGFHGDKSVVGDLSTEMYERLAGIYGFRSFNYLTEDTTTAANAPSWDHLLSTSTTSTTASPAAPISSLADLLSTTAVDSTATTTEEQILPALPLSNLPAFDKFRVLHVDPMVLAIDDFFTIEECDEYIRKSTDAELLNAKFGPMESRSKTVGKDAMAMAQRTSTTWFHHYQNVPEFMSKASRLLGLDDISRWEEPQAVRYRRDEKYTWHLDALAPSDDLQTKGGQRVATLLVYLTDLEEGEGGATIFRDLGGTTGGPLKVQPKKGSACLFFPAAGGIPNVPFDIRTLHCGETVSSDAKNDKWLAQLWLRERAYTPTAPPNNSHNDAFDAISAYCATSKR